MHQPGKRIHDLLMLGGTTYVLLRAVLHAGGRRARHRHLVQGLQDAQDAAVRLQIRASGAHPASSLSALPSFLPSVSRLLVVHCLSIAPAHNSHEAALEGQVNLVNAEHLLKERGIALVEEKSTDTGDFGTILSTEVVTEKKSYLASGTLFGKQFLRLVQVGPYRLDAHLDGPLLVFTHFDRPGLNHGRRDRRPDAAGGGRDPPRPRPRHAGARTAAAGGAHLGARRWPTARRAPAAGRAATC